MKPTLRTEYWDDLKARSAFKEFVHEIHELDFSDWESCGYWDHAYTPFSYFMEEKVIANVCIYSLEAVIHGTRARVAQVSAVGTLPEWRRRGLNRQLTDIGLERMAGQGEPVFLFSTTQALPFYRRCGFTPIEEYLEFVEGISVTGRSGTVPLDPGRESDRQRIYGYARERVPVSNRFCVLNPRLLMFHALYYLRNHVYEIPDLNCLVFCKREQGCLSLYDIVGPDIPSFEELYPYLAEEHDQRVEFHFHTDKLAPGSIQTRPLSGNHPFVKDGFPVENPVFPFTSRA